MSGKIVGEVVRQARENGNKTEKGIRRERTRQTAKEAKGTENKRTKAAAPQGTSGRKKKVKNWAGKHEKRKPGTKKVKVTA